MAEERNKPEPRGSHSKAGGGELPSDLLTGQALLRTINEALQQYSQALRDVCTNGVKRSEELSQEYLKSQRERQTVYEESVKDDYRNYLTSIQQAWGQEQAQAKMDESTRGYLTTLNDRQIEYRKNLDDLQRNYMDTVQKHVNQVKQDYVTAYQDYLRSFQQALQKADVTSMDTQTLASVGQVLIAASNYAGQTLHMS